MNHLVSNTTSRAEKLETQKKCLYPIIDALVGEDASVREGTMVYVVPRILKDSEIVTFMLNELKKGLHEGYKSPEVATAYLLVIVHLLSTAKRLQFITDEDCKYMNER